MYIIVWTKLFTICGTMTKQEGRKKRCRERNNRGRKEGGEPEWTKEVKRRKNNVHLDIKFTKKEKRTDRRSDTQYK